MHLSVQHSDMLMVLAEDWTVDFVLTKCVIENICVSREMKSNTVEWFHSVL